MHSPLILYNLASVFSYFIGIAHLDIKNYLGITKSNALLLCATSTPKQLPIPMPSLSSKYLMLISSFLLQIQLSYNQSNIHHSLQPGVYFSCF